MTIEQLKKVYDEYSHCEFKKVDTNGTIFRRRTINPSDVCIGADGIVSIRYLDDNDAYAITTLNSIQHAFADNDGLNYIEGIFSSDEKAIEVAKKYFLKIKRDKIAEAEAELSKMKKDLEEYESRMKEG